MKKFLSRAGLSIALLAMFITNINLEYDDEIVASTVLFLFGLVLYFSTSEE